MDFNNGIIINFGKITGLSVTNGSREFTLPISFSHQCNPIVNGVSQALTWINIQSYTLTKVICQCNNYNSQGRLNAYHILVIGY